MWCVVRSPNSSLRCSKVSCVQLTVAHMYTLNEVIFAVSQFSWILILFVTAYSLVQSLSSLCYSCLNCHTVPIPACIPFLRIQLLGTEANFVMVLATNISCRSSSNQDSKNCAIVVVRKANLSLYIFRLEQVFMQWRITYFLEFITLSHPLVFVFLCI